MEIKEIARYAHIIKGRSQNREKSQTSLIVWPRASTQGYVWQETGTTPLFCSAQAWEKKRLGQHSVSNPWAGTCMRTVGHNCDSGQTRNGERSVSNR